MRFIRSSSWNEVLRKMIRWSNHPKSNERRYTKEAINKSKFLNIRSYTLEGLPVDDLDWSLCEIESDDISSINYMNCVEWASINVLSVIKSPKIKEIQATRGRREIGVLVRSDSKGWHIILDGCHRISAAYLQDNLVGKKVFIGEGKVAPWVDRWMWR